MTILDAFAVIALLRGEPAAPEVRGILQGTGARLTSVGLAEVVDHLVRLVGAPHEEAVLDVAQLGLTDPEPVDGELALRASLLRADHYHRTTRAVSLADCIAAETARVRRRALATSDPHLLDLCHDESIEVVALPDSDGRRWSPGS